MIMLTMTMMMMMTTTIFVPVRGSAENEGVEFKLQE